MTSLRRLSPLSLVLCACVAGPAMAQDKPVADTSPQEAISSDLSSRNISIQSNFTGARLVVFGTVEHSKQDASESGIYDIAVVVRGPDKTFVTRRKERTFGIWINRTTATFNNIPGFYGVLSTRPLDEIAKPSTLNGLGIGFDSLDLIPVGETKKLPEHKEFRDALVRVKKREGVYFEQGVGVVFISPSLFRATFDLPAGVPVGDYKTTVHLFRDGKLLGLNSSELRIQKVGFERFVYALAFDQPLIYGILAVLAAIASGLIASMVFRKD